ncbi:hypothetical protein, conserved [Eimeria praecox]|uniref:Transmembrane protein n=1 Tax=Eimeria praecox TaxID=51316 RepID=U6G5Q1_9EIME|nr:hypothetical protein, conserved [Eimeria praecox]
MLASPSHSTQQVRESLEDVYAVPDEQRRGNKRRKELCNSPFYGRIAIVAIFAIVFVASHCLTHIRHGRTAWPHQQRRLADEQPQGAGNGTGKDDSPTCDWLKDVRQGRSTMQSSARSGTPTAPSRMGARLGGHGVKRIWNDADDEELQNLSKMQKGRGLPVDSDGSIQEEGLSAQLESLIEEALVAESYIHVEPWLLDPDLEVPTDLLFDSSEGEGTSFSQDSTEAGTSNSRDGTIPATTATDPFQGPFGASSAASAATVQQLSQQTPGAAAPQVQLPSSTSNPQEPPILDYSNAGVNSSVSLTEQAEHGSMSGAKQGLSNHVHEQREAGLQIGTCLKMDVLDACHADLLMACLEELVAFAMHNVKRTLTAVRPVFRVERLALYLLIADSLYATSKTLGDSAQRHTWWNGIMAELPANIVLGSDPNPRQTSRDILALGEKIKDGLETFRSGIRPLPEVLVPLKREILCSGLLRRFQRGAWSYFRLHDDEWKKQ